jgi:hypothetical protein
MSMLAIKAERLPSPEQPRVTTVPNVRWRLFDAYWNWVLEFQKRNRTAV